MDEPLNFPDFAIPAGSEVFMDSFTPFPPIWVEGPSGPEQIGWLFSHRSLNCWMVDHRYSLTQLMIDSEHNFHKWDADRAKFVQIPSPLHELNVRIDALKRMIAKIELHESVAKKIEPTIWPLVFVKSRMQIAAPSTFDLSRFTTRLAIIGKMQADVRETHQDGVIPLETYISTKDQEVFMYDLYMLSKAIEPREPPAKREGVPQRTKIDLNMDIFKPMNVSPDPDEDE